MNKVVRWERPGVIRMINLVVVKTVKNVFGYLSIKKCYALRYISAPLILYIVFIIFNSQFQESFFISSISALTLFLGF